MTKIMQDWMSSRVLPVSKEEYDASIRSGDRLWVYPRTIPQIAGDPLVRISLTWGKCHFPAHQLNAIRWCFSDVNRPGRMTRYYEFYSPGVSPAFGPTENLVETDLKTVLIFLSALLCDDPEISEGVIAICDQEGPDSVYNHYSNTFPYVESFVRLGLYDMAFGKKEAQKPELAAKA